MSYSYNDESVPALVTFLSTQAVLRNHSPLSPLAQTPTDACCDGHQDWDTKPYTNAYTEFPPPVLLVPRNRRLVFEETLNE